MYIPIQRFPLNSFKDSQNGTDPKKEGEWPFGLINAHKMKEAVMLICCCPEEVTLSDQKKEVARINRGEWERVTK